ncbi:hypothetical protein [Rhodocytophaga rosea]
MDHATKQQARLTIFEYIDG